MSLQEAQQFVGRFIKGEFTSGEYAAFLQWLKDASVEELTIIAEMHESMHDEWVLPGAPSAAWVTQLERKLNDSIEETATGDRELAPIVAIQPSRKIWWNAGMIRWNSWMSAASVVVTLSAGAFLYVHQMRSKAHERSDREKLLSMVFVNPRGGGQREMVLADGSKVWLNAGSVLKYPPQFTGSERLVELSGEAFFEVSRTSGRPFRVLIKDAEVDVLGTFFTIMAYDDEPESRTTVVNGAVKVTSGEQSVILKPGEQAEVVYASPGGQSGATVVHSWIDPNLVLAWKGGIYRFNTELYTILREVGRAYDVKIEYQPGVENRQIAGMLDLNKSLDVALKQLEVTLLNKIHFKQIGKTIIASPT
jgi:hypothetical protein